MPTATHFERRGWQINRLRRTERIEHIPDLFPNLLLPLSMRCLLLGFSFPVLVPLFFFTDSGI